MKRLLIAVLLVTLAVGGRLAAATALPNGCVNAPGTSCGVGADQAAGVFHGLIAVTGQGWVLATAANSGNDAGCGDCIWTLVIDCPTQTPDNPSGPAACTQASGSPLCQPGQLLYRLYLATSTQPDHVVGTVCIGGASQVVPVGDVATVDVERYLRDVAPPDLAISARPSGLTLAGLPTYFNAAAAGPLTPTPFGGPEITETITIRPTQLDWHWGDGTDSGWVPVTETVSHRYRHGGRLQGSLTTQWAATYTVSFEGATFGPYDATGRLTKTQTFTERVATTDPVLVSAS